MRGHVVASRAVYADWERENSHNANRSGIEKTDQGTVGVLKTLGIACVAERFCGISAVSRTAFATIQTVFLQPFTSWS